MTKKANPDIQNNDKYLFGRALPSYLPDIVIQTITQIESRPLGLKKAKENLEIWEKLIYNEYSPILWDKINKRSVKDKQSNLGLNVLYAAKVSHHDFKVEKEREAELQTAYENLVHHCTETLKAISRFQRLAMSDIFYTVQFQNKKARTRYIWAIIDRLQPLLKRFQTFNTPLSTLSFLYNSDTYQAAVKSRQRNAPHSDFIRAFVSCVLAPDSKYPIKRATVVHILEEMIPILYDGMHIEPADIQKIIRKSQKVDTQAS